MFTGYFFTIWCCVFVLFGLRCCHANYKSNGGPFSTLVPTFRFHTSIEKREKESGPMKTSSYYFRTKKKREKRRERRSEREEIKRRKLSGKMGGIHLAPGVVSSSCAAASSASSSSPFGKWDVSSPNQLDGVRRAKKNFVEQIAAFVLTVSFNRLPHFINGFGSFEPGSYSRFKIWVDNGRVYRVFFSRP